MLLSLLVQATLATTATIPVILGRDANIDARTSLPEKRTDAMFPSPSLLAPNPIIFDVTDTNLAMEIVPLRPYRTPLGPPDVVYELINRFDENARSSASQHNDSEPIDVKRIGVAQAGMTLNIEPTNRPHPVRDLLWSDTLAVATGLRLHFHEVFFWPSRLYLFDQNNPKTGDYVIGVGSLIPTANPLSNDTRVVTSN